MAKAAFSVVLVLMISLPVYAAQSPGEPAETPVRVTPAKVEILQPGEGFPDDTPRPGQAQPHELPETHEATEHDHEESAGPIRCWLRAEYLLWITKDARFPTLLTTGSTTAALPGAIGQPATEVLFGGTVDFQERHGGRFTLGYCIDPDSGLAIEGSYLFLGSRQVGNIFVAPAPSPGLPLLARPFFNTATGAEDASLSAYPGLINGSVDIKTTNSFQGAEANLAMSLWQSEKCRLDGLVGFRYWRLGDNLRILEDTAVSAGAGTFAGAAIRVSDFFDTTNNFYGAQVGVRGGWQWKRLDFEFIGKIALGGSFDDLTVRGATIINGVASNGGLLALSSNSGRFHHSEFAAIPEAGVNIAWNITNHCKFLFGYTFVYWDNVFRTGEQIDRAINPNLIPTSTTFGVPGGPARPAPISATSDFWAQGFSFGVEIRY